MTTILSLTDFSESSFNAARFAVRLAGTIPECTVILLHAYPIVDAQPVSEVPVQYDEAAIRHESWQRLQELENDLEAVRYVDTTIVCVSERAPLTDAVNRVGLEHAVRLVLFGCKKHSTLDKFLFGSNAERLIKECALPLLAVPESAIFAPVERAFLACELHDMERFPAAAVLSLLNLFKSRLVVVNVDRREEEIADTDRMLQQEKAHALLDAANPEYLYLNGDVIEELKEAAYVLAADMIIVVHRKHGLFYRLFHTSVSTRLATKGRMPVLIVQELPLQEPENSGNFLRDVVF